MQLSGCVPLLLHSLTSTHTHLFFRVLVRSHRQFSSKQSSQGRDAHAQHHLIGFNSGCSRQALAPRTLPPRSPGLVAPGAPSASPWPYDPDLATRPGRAAACPRPLHPPAALSSRSQAARPGDPHPHKSPPPRLLKRAARTRRLTGPGAYISQRATGPPRGGARPSPPRGTLGVGVGRWRLRSIRWGRAAGLVFRRSTAAIAAAAGSSSFLAARRTQRSATVSVCASSARSAAGGPTEGRASSCEQGSGSRAVPRRGDGPGLSCGGPALRGGKLLSEASLAPCRPLAPRRPLGRALGGGRWVTGPRRQQAAGAAALHRCPAALRGKGWSRPVCSGGRLGDVRAWTRV